VIDRLLEGAEYRCPTATTGPSAGNLVLSRISSEPGALITTSHWGGVILAGYEFWVHALPLCLLHDIDLFLCPQIYGEEYALTLRVTRNVCLAVTVSLRYPNREAEFWSSPACQSIAVVVASHAPNIDESTPKIASTPASLREAYRFFLMSNPTTFERIGDLS